MTDAELLKLATRFELLSYDKGIHYPRVNALVIERRTYVSDQNESWAICDGLNSNLNHNGEWEYEPSSSNRDQDFFKRCRWNNLKDAIEFAQTHMQKYPTGYKPEENL